MVMTTIRLTSSMDDNGTIVESAHTWLYESDGES